SQKSFVDLVLDPNIGNLRTWIQGAGLFNAEYIYQNTSDEGQMLEYDWDVFEKNPAQFRIGGFRANDGQEVYWGREDVKEPHDFLIRVQASSTMPVFMPPVEIDGQTYVDGALGPSGGIALDAAKAAGYEKFLVILTRGRNYVKKPFRAGAVVDRAFKDFPAVSEALARRPANYNRTREELFDLEADGKAYVYAPTGFTVSNQERRISRLKRSYDEGSQQIREEIPAIKEFLGLPQ
ncbi:MAG: patatin family protein, partial [Scrofimicrobium sp.]